MLGAVISSGGNMTSPQETGPTFNPTPEIVHRLDGLDVEDFIRLTPQLSQSAGIDRDAVADKLVAAIRTPNSMLVVIRDENHHIQAAAYGVINYLPIAGPKAWIEDVVTDENHRGKGYAGVLTDTLETWFISKGVSSSNLTSNPDRGAAGKLYERRGYKQRDTRVYRKQLGKTALGPKDTH